MKHDIQGARSRRWLTAMLLSGAGAVAFCLSLRADPDDPVPYPEGYRTWVHVKSTLIGPQSSWFAVSGGLHHYYANEKAMEGFRSGKYPDGAVVIDDLLETKETDGVSSEGSRRRLAVMMKDSKRFGETGGWGFEVFKGDGRQAALMTAKARAACFGCHTNARESVFTKFRQ
jgi:hypothetical protein